MKRIIYIFISLLFIFGSCIFKHPENKVIQSSNRNDQKEFHQTTKSYIGFVNRYYFQKTNEFYVDLYFKYNDIDNEKYEKLSKNGDTIIFKDDENCRTRIPIELAKKEFDFSGLDTLFLFDKEHNLLTKALCVRSEFLDQNISPVFTAVYKAENQELTDKALYCIGNLKDKIIPNRFKSFNDSLLTKEIAKEIKISAQHNFSCIHYHQKDHPEIISILNTDTLAIIVEKVNDSYQYLYKSHENECITEVVFVPIIRNGRPILLTKSVRPETDIAWNSLLIFDGNSYQIADRQRIIE